MATAIPTPDNRQRQPQTFSTLPPEILLTILTHCTVPCILTLRLLNRSTSSLITTYQNQIASAVVARTSAVEDDCCYAYLTLYAYIEIPFPSSQGLALFRDLRRLRRRKLCLAMLGLIGGREAMVRYARGGTCSSLLVQ